MMEVGGFFFYFEAVPTAFRDRDSHRLLGLDVPAVDGAPALLLSFIGTRVLGRAERRALL